jgi:AraC-like DNA-binding protein
MKPLIQKLPLSEHSSFVADTFRTPYFETPWHYHEEYELVLILEGRGKRFVGNHVSDYQEGELDFLGSNLPHWYRKEDARATGASLVIHFREAFLGPGFPGIPEMARIGLLFGKARMGLHLKGSLRERVSGKMHELLKLQGMERLICLLTILTLLADATQYDLLSSPELGALNVKDSDRINKVFDYVMEHFKEDIRIGEVADIASMSESGFSRYIKNRTKKNFSHFVNEIRIGYACKRLMESDLSVSQVCFESGFNNLTHFNKQFKEIVKCTPYQFRRRSRV